MKTAPLTLCIALFLTVQVNAQGRLKTETFDKEPGWEGINNRSAETSAPATIKQDFGYSPTQHAGGTEVGEIGGHVSQAGEVAYYAMKIDSRTFNDKLTASGSFACASGSSHVLIGFFNADTTKEWRTPNTLGLRLQGRGEGDFFYAFADYCTSRWRAGGQSFTEAADRKSSRAPATRFPSAGKSIKWSFEYDPNGNGGKGVLTAKVGDHTAVCELDPTHKEDGATFNRFGIMNIMKSADQGSQLWFDDITVNGQLQSFDRDPQWEGMNNRKTWQSKIVRPRFDFGYSPTNHAGGKSAGEMGGMIFRGDCRYADRMACYGDKVNGITFEKPFRFSGKVTLARGVTDSGALFGFYNSKDSMRRNDAQDDGVPENCMAIQIEGPSSEGFLFYPLYRVKGAKSTFSRSRDYPYILPDGAPHEFAVVYDPNGASGKGTITVTFDGKSKTMELAEGDKSRGATFDRFGVVTTWIDGNSVDAYWDDLTYTVGQ